MDEFEKIQFPRIKNAKFSSNTFASSITPVTPLEYPPEGLTWSISEGEENLTAGAWGHMWGCGWYIVNEELECVFMENEEEYHRLWLKYIDKTNKPL